MYKSNPVNVLEYLNLTAGLFKDKKIKNSRLNAELLLCDVLDCSRIDLYLNYEKPLTDGEVTKLRNYVRRRLNHEPLQYILGKAHFYGLEFIVNDKVLIPRQETELLVERVIDDIKKQQLKKVSIFEIGSGTGCISISIAKSLHSADIGFEIFSVDISKDSVEVSDTNKKLNGLENENIKFYVKDVFEIEKLNKNFDYIISNPPYISKSEYENLDEEVKNYEPAVSLTDGGDGLKFFQRIFKIASDPLFTGKVFCEIGFGQKDDIERILSGYNFNKVLFHKDYSGITRIAEIHK